MALVFSEGSIGGDIERINLNQLGAFYGKGRAAQALNRRTTHAPPRRAHWIERYRHRPIQHRGAPRPSADQSPYLVLLPLRTADGQRRRSERLRRRHLGPVLHLPGLQRARRLDAHLQRRRRHRRVSRNRRQEWRSLLLQVRQPSSVRSRSAEITVPYHTETGWPKRNSPCTARITAPSSASERKMGEHPLDAGAPRRR